MNPSATLVFGSDVEKLEYSNSGPQSFRALVISATKEGEVAATTEGEVVFYVPVSWSFPKTGNRPAEAPLVGSGLAHITVPFGVAPDKDKPEAYVLTWRNPRTLGLSSDGAGASLVQAPITTDVTPTGGTATITPTLQFQEQLSHAVTTAGNTLSIGGGPTTPIFSETVTVTSDVGGGHQEQSQVNVTDSFSMSFTAIVPLPQPEKLDTKATLTVHFRIDSDATASNGEEENITKWYQGLSKRLRTSIEGGKTRINLLAKASTTGTNERQPSAGPPPGEARAGHPRRPGQFRRQVPHPGDRAVAAPPARRGPGGEGCPHLAGRRRAGGRRGGRVINDPLAGPVLTSPGPVSGPDLRQHRAGAATGWLSSG